MHLYISYSFQAQCFIEETSPVGVCEMNIICLYFFFFSLGPYRYLCLQPWLLSSRLLTCRSICLDVPHAFQTTRVKRNASLSCQPPSPPLVLRLTWWEDHTHGHPGYVTTWSPFPPSPFSFSPAPSSARFILQTSLESPASFPLHYRCRRRPRLPSTDCRSRPPVHPPSLLFPSKLPSHCC